MDISYKVIGTDGLEYGPITLGQLKVWIGEGRILPETKILRSDTNAWQMAGDYAELAMPQPAPAPLAARPTAVPPLRPTQPMRDPMLARQARTGAGWFFWIAALSLVNTIMALTHAGLVFLFGLGATQIIDGFAQDASSGGMAIGLGLNLMVTGLFVLFGVFARKGQTWAYIVGLVAYSLDALLLVLISMMMTGAPAQWLALAFHGYVIYRIIAGLQANIKLNSQA